MHASLCSGRLVRRRRRRPDGSHLTLKPVAVGLVPAPNTFGRLHGRVEIVVAVLPNRGRCYHTDLDRGRLRATFTFTTDWRTAASVADSSKSAPMYSGGGGGTSSSWMKAM